MISPAGNANRSTERSKMIVLFLLNRFLPKDWEPTTIWYLAGIEMLIIDAPFAGILYGLVSG
jgi:hypothetical protein